MISVGPCRFTRQGKLLYADKQKIQDLISQQRINLADVKYLDLDRVNIILNLFVNPQAEDSAGFLWDFCGDSPRGFRGYVRFVKNISLIC